MAGLSPFVFYGLIITVVVLLGVLVLLTVIDIQHERRNKPLKKYYREWPMCWGRGVMLGFDTTMAKNQKEASAERPKSAYIAWDVAEKSKLGYYDAVVVVPEHLVDLPDKELAHWFDSKSKRWLRKRNEFI